MFIFSTFNVFQGEKRNETKLQFSYELSAIVLRKIGVSEAYQYPFDFSSGEANMKKNKDIFSVKIEMIFFLLPRTYLYTYKHLELIECSDKPKPYISTSLSNYLKDIKERIEEHADEWEIYKKYTNPCEFIHTNIPNFPTNSFGRSLENSFSASFRPGESLNKNKSVSKYVPLSRSYFKMVEIIQHFNLFTCYSDGNLSTLRSDKLWDDMESFPVNSSTCLMDSETNPNMNFHSQSTENSFSSTLRSDEKMNAISHPIRTFHLAEGPGGFIEAFLKMRNNPLDKYIGMTIQDKKNDNTIPSWKKSGKFMRENYNNVFIENGEDQTGNILSLQNFVYCKNKYESSMDFITADGGFDFSTDFNNQENSIVRLLFAQIAFAICMQKPNGTFILKVFDTFMLHSIDLLYLLSSLYREVYICKPQTSRYANSEKYVVCKYFIPSSCSVIYPYLFECFQNMMENDCSNRMSSYVSTPAATVKWSPSSFRPENSLNTKWKKNVIFSTNSFGRSPENSFLYSIRPDENLKILSDAPLKPKMKNTKKNATEIGRFLNIPISNLFISRLEEYNSILGQQQIENIYNTIVLIETRYKNEKINNLLKTNIQKSIQWCVKHKIPHNFLSV
jgi:23S rRNA U2552 (ribose-2'-O)-methylase RlmE/FtsJ